MSFFIRRGGSRGGPRGGPRGGQRGAQRGGPREAGGRGRGSYKQGDKRKADDSIKLPEKPYNNRLHEDEEISSDSDEERPIKNIPDHVSSEDEETAPEKRLRLAKMYLEEIERQEAERSQTEEVRKDLVAQRLKDDVLEQAGKLQKKVADYLLPPDPDEIIVLKGHQLPVTCIALSSDGEFVYSASKDCSIIKWSVSQKKKLKTIPKLKPGKEGIGHTAHILSLAVSTDNKFLVSAGRDKIIQVWNADTMEHIRSFKGHRDVVSGLVFRKGTHQLFSTSHDRCVKIWNLDEMTYVETLFGHQDAVTAVDSLTRDRAITAGGRDTSVRVWKVVEESQLVYNGHTGSIDSVRLVNEEFFITGGDDGSVMMWGVMKKKPLFSKPNAHGVSPENQQGNWISSVAAMQNTDVFASGSNDGEIRFWKSVENFRQFTPLFTVPAVGFVNDLHFDSSANILVAGVGQEHKLGRWWRLKEAKNCIVVILLKRKEVPTEVVDNLNDNINNNLNNNVNSNGIDHAMTP